MTTYNFATASLRAPSSYRHTLLSNTGVLSSILTGHIQTISRPGERWGLEVTWNNLDDANRLSLLAFFARLNGATHRVLFAPFNHTQRGTFSGTPVVDGSSQTGNTLNIRSAGLSVTNWARAGDWIAISGSNHWYMVTADTNSDGSGDVALPIMPRLVSSPSDGTAITVSIASVYGQFIMTSPLAFDNVPHGTYPLSSLTLTFVQDLAA